MFKWEICIQHVPLLPRLVKRQVPRKLYRQLAPCTLLPFKTQRSVAGGDVDLDLDLDLDLDVLYTVHTCLSLPSLSPFVGSSTGVCLKPGGAAEERSAGRGASRGSQPREVPRLVPSGAATMTNIRGAGKTGRGAQTKKKRPRETDN